MIKRITTDCDGVRITVAYDDQTDATVGLKLDISELNVKSLTTAGRIIEGILELGYKGPDVD